jgi:hypothetical protein
MKQTVSAAVQAVTPPILWNAFQRFRGLGQRYPRLEFGQFSTIANAAPILEGRFAELFERYRALDPFEPPDRQRFVAYMICRFADLCRHVPGDFVCAGISFGIMPRILFDYVDFPSLGKTFHLIDPFEGIGSHDRISARYNCDPDYVMRQYPEGSPIILHRKRIPLRLPGKIAFVTTNTGNPEADAEALPIFYEAMSPGGIFVLGQYANFAHVYQPALSKLDFAPIWLPSGQGIIVKQ